MISRRAVLLTGAALAATSPLAACGSSDPPALASLPSYAGKGETNSFDGTWDGEGQSDWRFEVKDGVFTGTGQGRRLSSGWTAAVAGYIRKDHSVEGAATSSGSTGQHKVDGNWPRIAIHWNGGDPSIVRMRKVMT